MSLPGSESALSIAIWAVLPYGKAMAYFWPANSAKACSNRRMSDSSPMFGTKNFKSPISRSAFRRGIIAALPITLRRHMSR